MVERKYIGGREMKQDEWRCARCGSELRERDGGIKGFTGVYSYRGLPTEDVKKLKRCASRMMCLVCYKAGREGNIWTVFDDGEMFYWFFEEQRWVNVKERPLKK